MSSCLTQGVLCSAVALAACAIASARTVHADEPNASNYDVLGIALGSAADDIQKNIKLDGATFAPANGKLTMGNFTSPELHFGVTVADDNNPNKIYYSMEAPDHDYLSIAFDSRTPQTVISMRRDHIYSKDKRPLLTDLKNSLVSKYGTPVGIEEGPGIILWNKDSQIKYAPGRGYECYGVLYGVSDFTQGKFGQKPAGILAKCGSWMMVQISKASDNPALVSQFSLHVANLAAVQASYTNLMSMLNAGADATAKGEKEKATENKTNL